MKATSILDPKFKYINASKTDISKTFRRARKEIAMQKAAEKVLRLTFTGMQFPVPDMVDDIEYQQCLKIMHQDIAVEYPWGS